MAPFRSAQIVRRGLRFPQRELAFVQGGSHDDRGRARLLQRDHVVDARDPTGGDDGDIDRVDDRLDRLAVDPLYCPSTSTLVKRIAPAPSSS